VSTQAGPKENDGCPDKDTDGDGSSIARTSAPTRRARWSETAAPKRTGTTTASSTRRTSARRAEDKDKFEDEDGCPDPDNDKDGILDEKDKCPNEPRPRTATRMTTAARRGSGDGQEVHRCREGINFRRNSADIKASSFPLLKEA